jgi:hypothetical protein
MSGIRCRLPRADRRVPAIPAGEDLTPDVRFGASTLIDRTTQMARSRRAMNHLSGVYFAPILLKKSVLLLV